MLPDGTGVLYSRRRAVQTRILEHRFGTPVEADREVFGEGVADRACVPAVYSEDGRFVAAVVDGQVHLWARASRDGNTLVASGPTGLDAAFGGRTPSTNSRS